MAAPATFYTISDARFFAGTAALVNSLRLTGNGGEVVVLDLGLTAEQRERLGVEVRFASMPPELGDVPHLYKPFPATLDPSGTVVIIDGDMVVTRSFEPILERCEAGQVIAVDDIPDQRDRWFAEWEQALELTGPPRRQPYANGGLLAFSVERHPQLLHRYWEVSKRLPTNQHMSAGGGYEQPFWAGDQDAMNALLMSEVPADQVSLLPEEEGPSTDLLTDVEVLDPRTLRCSLRGREPFLLHHWGGPKPWQTAAWMRVRRDAYVRLLPRVLLADDVPIRLRPDELPRWLRPGGSARAELFALSAFNGATRAVQRRLPASTRARAGRVAHRLAKRRR